MAELKYKYDPKEASYKPVVRSFREIFRNIFIYIFSTIIIGFSLAYFIFPKLYSIENYENTELTRMKVEYEILNDRLDETNKVVQNLKERDRNLYRSYFDLPIPLETNKEESKIEKLFSNYLYGDLMDVTYKKLDKLSNDVVEQSKSLDQLMVMIEKREKSFQSIPAIQPIANKDMKRLASGYGIRIHPILKIGKMHWGIDFKADTNTPIYATADGRVEYASYKSGFGRTVILNHENGYKTLYAHQNKIKARQGQRVKRGDIIGYVGSTGMSTGAHLHYEVHKGKEKLNPITFFSGEVSPDQLKKLYEESEKISYSFD